MTLFLYQGLASPESLGRLGHLWGLQNRLPRTHYAWRVPFKIEVDVSAEVKDFKKENLGRWGNNVGRSQVATGLPASGVPLQHARRVVREGEK